MRRNACLPHYYIGLLYVHEGPGKEAELLLNLIAEIV